MLKMSSAAFNSEHNLLLFVKIWQQQQHLQLSLGIKLTYNAAVQKRCIATAKQKQMKRTDILSFIHR